MPKRAKITIVKNFSLTDLTIDQISKILEKMDFLSGSEVVRYCVSQTFKKEFPDYIYNKSAVDKKKRMDLEQEKDKVELTIDEFLKKHVPRGMFAVAFDDLERYYVMHDLKEGVHPIKVDRIREWVGSNPERVAYHNSVKESVRDIITNIEKQYLKNYYMIDLDDEHNIGNFETETKEEENESNE